MSLKKISISLLTLVVLVVGAWLGASIYLGRTTAKWVSTLVEQTAKQKTIRLVNLQHKQGLFSSVGQFEVRLNDLGADVSTGRQKLAVIVDYRVANLLLPGSSMRFEWSMKPSGEYGAEFNRIFGSELTLEGKGKLAYGGRAISSLKLPELVMRDGEDRMQISPSTGQLAWVGNALSFDWKTDRITLRSDGQPIDIVGVNASADITNRNRGIGTMKFGVDKFSTQTTTAQGFGVQSTVAERGDRLDILFNHQLASLDIAGQKVRDILVDLTISDLDISSVDTLSAIASDSDDFQSLTADEQSKAVLAARKLLNQGLVIALPKISAQIGSGSINGDVKIEILKSNEAAPVAFSTQKSLRASGQLFAKGKVIDQTQKMMALMMGLATDSKEGLKSSFTFSGNTLKANGKSYDVSDSLSMIDDYINGLLYP